jgi:hypothetical protein
MSETGIRSLIDMDDQESFVDPEILLRQLLDDPNLVQHLSRTEHHGIETIVAYFRIAFEPGQQRQILHVPFAPPLKLVPQVKAHATDHQEVRVRVTDRQKFGIRAEVILPVPSVSAQRIIVEVIASEAV